jgi:hypothetical protein
VTTEAIVFPATAVGSQVVVVADGCPVDVLPVVRPASDAPRAATATRRATAARPIDNDQGTEREPPGRLGVVLGTDMI